MLEWHFLCVKYDFCQRLNEERVTIGELEEVYRQEAEGLGVRVSLDSLHTLKR